jgi:hypothetical protein
LSHNVKGVLFIDYVRMLRSHKGVDWAMRLAPEDMKYLTGKIDPEGWYPMATFERMGNAILKEIAGGEVEGARMWGRLQVDSVRVQTPTLVAHGDAVETLMRFRVLRSTFFDFDALRVSDLCEGHATIRVSYHMGATAEEAASFQTMGFFERLVELAGATSVRARFVKRSWTGDAETIFELDWLT